MIFRVIYQTVTVFHRDMHANIEKRVKNYDAKQSNFDDIRDETLSRIFHIFYQWKKKPRSKFKWGS